ncbi:MAG: ABC transporter ATP-binding protein [Candidatus Binatia bacterium]
MLHVMNSPSQAILDVQHLSKTYQNGPRTLTVLHDISFSLPPAATCAIVGPSGSGKTTLLGLCAGLDRPTAGEVYLAGHPLHCLQEEELANVRNTAVGFVFQSFQLIPTLTALENVMIPVELRGAKHARLTAEKLLHQVGLGERFHHYPVQLSGGEQQRVALARAFIHQPRVLFADEPTGNLDEETSEQIVELLFSLNRATGATLVLVTHDMELAQRTQRIIRLRGGRVVSDKAMRHSSKTEEPENRGNGESNENDSTFSCSDSPYLRFSNSSKEKQE